MTKLGEITIRGRAVSMFAPPHDEPDFPWVDVEELARAFLPRSAAKRMVSHSQQFGGDVRSVSTARNADRIATIMCHAMAQGLCGAIDQWNGHRGDNDDGPAHVEYCLAAGRFAADKSPMTLDALIHAFHNPGGKFLRKMTEET